MRFCLIKIGYDSSFHGLQYQPGLRTVMGEIKKLSDKMGIKKIYASSRTDSFVRASGNLIEAEYEDCQSLCNAINSIKGIYVLEYASSETYIPLRGMFSKEYLYISRVRPAEEKIRSVISEFLSSDYSKFSKDSARKVYLENIDFKIFDFGTILKFRGRSFSWNFVRISSECILNRSLGKIRDEEWVKIVNGESKCRYKGSGKNLILYRTILPFDMIKYSSNKLVDLQIEIIIEFLWLYGMDKHFLIEISEIANSNFI